LAFVAGQFRSHQRTIAYRPPLSNVRKQSLTMPLWPYCRLPRRYPHFPHVVDCVGGPSFDLCVSRSSRSFSGRSVSPATSPIHEEKHDVFPVTHDASSEKADRPPLPAAVFSTSPNAFVGRRPKTHVPNAFAALTRSLRGSRATGKTCGQCQPFDRTAGVKVSTQVKNHPILTRQTAGFQQNGSFPRFSASNPRILPVSEHANPPQPETRPTLLRTLRFTPKSPTGIDDVRQPMHHSLTVNRQNALRVRRYPCW